MEPRAAPFTPPVPDCDSTRGRKIRPRHGKQVCVYIVVKAACFLVKASSNNQQPSTSSKRVQADRSHVVFCACACICMYRQILLTRIPLRLGFSPCMYLRWSSVRVNSSAKTCKQAYTRTYAQMGKQIHMRSQRCVLPVQSAWLATCLCAY